MISIIGVGRVGTITALLSIIHKLDYEIRLVDVVPGLAEGEALDLLHASAILGLDVDVKGSTDYSIIEGSDLVIVTAGKPRKPGMTREELLLENAKVVSEIAYAVKRYAPDSIVLLTTNPVDALTYVTYRKTEFPRERVIGFSGVLDSARLSYYAGRRLGLSPNSVNSIVIGMHGEEMLPLMSLSNIMGIPLTHVLSEKDVEEIVKDTKEAGASIIKLRGYSSSYAPAAGLVIMAEAIIRDAKRAFSASVVLKGEYGFNDVAAEVPVVVGRRGVLKIVELPLNEDLLLKLRRSVEGIRRMINSLPEEYR